MFSRERIKAIFGGLKPKGEAKENQPTVSADIVFDGNPSSKTNQPLPNPSNQKGMNVAGENSKDNSRKT